MKIEEIEEEIKKAEKLIRQGYSRKLVISRLKEIYFPGEKIFEMAKCRIISSKKFPSHNIFFDEYGLKYSTPPLIAQYRAKRVKGNSIADVSCGVGVQLIFFAKNARVIGIEKDSYRAKMAILNMEINGIKNYEIIEGDCLDKKIVERIDADAIFSDPSRKENEKKRKLNSLEPNPLKVYEIYKKRTDKIAFELPPQISRNEILIEGEKEYTSLNFTLNRLALYTNELASCNISAVSLPSEERITDMDEKIEVFFSDKIGEFIYEIDVTVVKAGLVSNLFGKIGFDGNLIKIGKRRSLATSSIPYNSSFLRRYKVMEICSFNLSEINKILKNINARKAILRIDIEPENYWNVRKKIESGLKGEKTYQIFKFEDKALIVEEG
ncbi:MAG: class I SAM-dependent methyltransferase [Thermoplasmatales archaeon]|nr:class I SAM-dependent methyltransferase [Thermoplasmatales archaeon]